MNVYVHTYIRTYNVTFTEHTYMCHGAGEKVGWIKEYGGGGGGGGRGGLTPTM